MRDIRTTYLTVEARLSFLYKEWKFSCEELYNGRYEYGNETNKVKSNNQAVEALARLIYILDDNQLKYLDTCGIECFFRLYGGLFESLLYLEEQDANIIKALDKYIKSNRHVQYKPKFFTGLIFKHIVKVPCALVFRHVLSDGTVFVRKPNCFGIQYMLRSMGIFGITPLSADLDYDLYENKTLGLFKSIQSYLLTSIVYLENKGA